MATQQEQTKGTAKTFWTNSTLHLIIIFLTSIVIYGNTFRHQYAVDDSIVILRNSFTKKGLKGMKGIWGEDTFVGFFGGRRTLVEGGRYRPLSVATFALENQLFGTPIKNKNGSLKLDKDGDVNYKGNPYVSHVINVLLYALLCLVVYLLLRDLFLQREPKKQLKACFIAFAGAMLYACHPIHTEAVANIKGRDEIMVFLGALLALYWAFKAYVSETNAAVAKYMLLATFGFLFSIFSKENTVTFIAIIPAAMLVFGGHGFSQIKRISLLTAPFIVLFAVFWFAVRQPILGEVASGKPIPELMNDPFLKIEGNRYVPYTQDERLATVLYTWADYLKLLVVPHPLTNDYYPKYVRTGEDIIPNFGTPYVLLSLLIHLVLALLAAWGTLKRRPFGFFILFYFATFSIVSNLIFPIGTNMAERFMFLPSMAFSALCAMGLYELAKRNFFAKAASPAAALNKLVLPLVVLIILYSGKTVSRNYAWKDDYTLFTTDINVSVHSAKLNNAVSGVLQDRANVTGSVFERKVMVEKALYHSRKATTLHPTYNNAWLLRGNANVLLGNILLMDYSNTAEQTRATYLQGVLKHYSDAELAYTEVIRLRPDHPDVKRNMSITLRDKGKLLGQYMGQLSSSLATLKKSYTFNPKDTETLRLLGIASGFLGNQPGQEGYRQEAVRYFKEALDITPNNVPVLYNLEMAYHFLGEVENRNLTHEKWKALNPDYNPSKAEVEVVSSTVSGPTE